MGVERVPTDDSGPIHFWDSVDLYLEEFEGAQTLMGYQVESDAATTGEVIELPDGIGFGMTYREAADLYPDETYTHDSLELVGIAFTAPHSFGVTAQASPDGSEPITSVWVGAIPACS